VMQHAVTNETEATSENIEQTLLAVQDIETPIIWFWPNADAGTNEISKMIRRLRENENPKDIHFIKNMEPYDFLRFLNASSGIIGNSSVAIREASYLGIPAINIGSRQANRERGPNVVDVAYNRYEIHAAILKHLGRRVKQSQIYGAGNAGKSIAKSLESH